MFRDSGSNRVSPCEGKETKSHLSKLWNSLEDDPLSREKLEFRLGILIQLLLRCEGGDRSAREELKAIS